MDVLKYQSKEITKKMHMCVVKFFPILLNNFHFWERILFNIKIFLLYYFKKN